MNTRLGVPLVLGIDPAETFTQACFATEVAGQSEAFWKRLKYRQQSRAAGESPGPL